MYYAPSPHLVFSCLHVHALYILPALFCKLVYYIRMCKLMLTENHGNNNVLYKTLYNHYCKSSYATSADAVDDSLERRERCGERKLIIPNGRKRVHVGEVVHLLLPVWCQHSLPLVVSCQSVDATLNQNQPELGILVLQDMYMHVQ